MSDELIDYEENKNTKKTETKKILAHTSNFNDFLLREELTSVIKEVAFEHPSEVQQQCIPRAILGADILCQAKSGTGKTAVFVLSTLQQLNAIDKESSILVIVNTKEMANQVKDEFQRFIKFFKNVSVDCFYGGRLIEDDIKRLNSCTPTIFIGTPGRVAALVEGRYVNFKHVKHFVLDECDVVLSNLEMKWDVIRIFTSCNINKQTMMFSATFNDVTRAECLKFLRDPQKIIVDDQKLTLFGLKQFYKNVTDKETFLEEFLDAEDFNQCVIFVSDKNKAKKLNEHLNKKGFPAIEIHAVLSTSERLLRFSMFKELKYRILVTTNLMSRGIDIQDVNLVVNYDMPESAETYLHRVGRAGRFETQGVAISLVADKADSAILNEVQSRFEVSIENYK